MKNKGQANLLVILGVVVLLAVAVGYWFTHRAKPAPSLPPAGGIDLSPMPQSLTPKASPYPNQTAEAQIKQVVQNFMDNFIKALPPSLNESAAVTALDLLSASARTKVANIGPSPTAALTTFAGASTAPEQGYTLDNVYEDKGTASVETTWNYSRGPIKKTFNLVFENNGWGIDTISQ